MLNKESLSFLWQCFRYPRQVGSLVPSSMALADEMTRELEPRHAPVIELGPGTGIFTRSILKRGIAPKDLLLIESNSDFVNHLQQNFPKVDVRCMNATQIGQTDIFGGRKAGCVICGVPFLLVTEDEAHAILEGVFSQMRPDAALYQVTYSLRSPFPEAVLKRLDLKVERIGGTVLNIPPASVYKLTRRDQSTRR